MLLVPGKRLGPYEILAALGAGGMGEVYRARDPRLDREVAIKVLPERLARDAEALARFEREAKSVAALSHPNILAIHDFGVDQGLSFAVMELLGGETLRSRLKQGTLSWRKAVEIGMALADGLSAAHSKGVIHRDLKPENIFLTWDGQVKILDFGLARKTATTRPEDVTSASTEAHLTKIGSVVGTLPYMSPEQVREAAIDARSDIFSFGVVLYEMVTGQRAFSRDTSAETVVAILKEDPPDLSQILKSIPSELEQLILHCLEKNPEQRFQSARDLAFALRVIETESWQRADQKKIQTDKELQTPQASIAVLPFADMSPLKDQEYFCDGLAEELINAVTKLEGLRVTARTSAFRFRGKELDVREIGKELNVSTVLQGSVRKAGNRLRITAQLINVADGYHLWSDRYDQEMDDVFAIQDEISLAIVEKLKVRLLGEEKAKLVKRYTVNLEAYDLYLKGRYYFNQLSADGFQKAIEYFKLALGKDPNYALAYAGLAESYAFLGFWGLTSPREALLKAKEAALKALALDNTLADVHHSLGLVRTFNYEWRIAQEEFKRAIEINPNYAFGHICYAVYLRLVGCVDEGLAEIKCARELDPFSVPVNAGAAYLFYSMRLYDETIEQCQKTLKMEPNFFQAHGYLALAYARKGMHEESLAEWKTLLTLRGARKVARVIQRAYEQAGYKGALINATKWMTRAFYLLHVLKYVPLMKRTYISPLMIAMFYAEAGEKDRAFRWLNRAYKEHEPQMLTLKVNPHWDSVRSDSRFEELLRKIGVGK